MGDGGGDAEPGEVLQIIMIRPIEELEVSRSPQLHPLVHRRPT